jgi:hypothetical protein
VGACGVIADVLYLLPVLIVSDPTYRSVKTKNGSFSAKHKLLADNKYLAFFPATIPIIDLIIVPTFGNMMKELPTTDSTKREKCRFLKKRALFSPLL